jgi:aminoglycoside phosphotransferase (APT) family kinase protein
MIASLVSQPPVADRLVEYLQTRLGVPSLRYAEEPVAITHGWETYIYRFRLEPTLGLPSRFAGRLILRAYSCGHGLTRARHEFAAQEHVLRLGYPAPQPLLLEEDGAWFGGPFLVMDYLPGQTLLDVLLARPWRIYGGPAQMAEMHACLHQLPAADFPRPPGPFLERHLEAMREHIRAHSLVGMRAGLDWLSRHRPDPPQTPRIIHLDFHPVNLLLEQDRCSGILDWNEADVGDRHADVATTIVLIRSAPVELPTALDRLLSLPARPMLRRRYLRGYGRLLPLDRQRLAYYIAWAAFRRLLCWGMWLHATPRITGSKPSSMRYLSADRVNILRECFRDWAGVGVRI